MLWSTSRRGRHKFKQVTHDSHQLPLTEWPSNVGQASIDAENITNPLFDLFFGNQPDHDDVGLWASVVELAIMEVCSADAAAVLSISFSSCTLINPSDKLVACGNIGDLVDQLLHRLPSTEQPYH